MTCSKPAPTWGMIRRTANLKNISRELLLTVTCNFLWKTMEIVKNTFWWLLLHQTVGGDADTHRRRLHYFGSSFDRKTYAMEYIFCKAAKRLLYQKMCSITEAYILIGEMIRRRTLYLFLDLKIMEAALYSVYFSIRTNHLNHRKVWFKITGSLLFYYYHYYCEVYTPSRVIFY